jgi:hypothetical protein
MFKSNRNLFVIAIMFFIFAAVFSVVFWPEVSLAVKIAMFAFGFGSGIALGGWFSKRTEAA